MTDFQEGYTVGRKMKKKDIIDEFIETVRVEMQNRVDFDTLDQFVTAIEIMEQVAGR